MGENQTEIESKVYNLILNPHTRDWERAQLREVIDEVAAGKSFDRALADLEVKFRPLALRNNLTPDVTDFYHQLVGNESSADPFDLSRHYAKDAPNQERAIFAGGCFWCMVEPFEKRPGIIAVFSGYTGGEVANPSYDQVVGQYTGHVEAVEIIFDKRVISYKELVELYWQLTDPTDAGGQFNDRGNNYKPIIFVYNSQQRQIATESKMKLIESDFYGRPIVTKIKAATTFWPAENFHQEFYKKNPKRYKGLERERKLFLRYLRLKGRLRAILKQLNIIR
ncbi:peptide-methionine (S)-S-oxide reductase MsrA [Pediococcus stilesii]|uniref:Peptide methionine sulfoxide reductase MsrA n=1 Tax=Pediococcus stilesii TaxID=331679 RepID=A0A5R9BU36_9LACO|nr:peptide-methionine (S)-S-oxide reductase MsrA [Pediococcus stilesii]TLQ04206.1 peptide-methionine (S)-S-oxide reductase MsrA [Pediococcus stilesii]